jgi:signal transduction histidine kinase
MTGTGERPTVPFVFDELPAPSERPPRIVRALRAIGGAALVVVVWATVTNDPAPSLHGTGLVVLLSLVALLAGIAWSRPRTELRPGRRFAGLMLVAAGGIGLAAAQPDGAAIGAAYYVIAIAGVRMPLRPGTVASVVAVGGQALAVAFSAKDPLGQVIATVFSTLPWYLVFRMMRHLSEGRRQAEGLVEELRESREAHAEAAALEERSRLARDMHDVLAHSLSALALQLEGTRLLARDRGANPEVVAGVERAHHLAAAGLEEARRAIAALRGDELPGPERLRALADAFAEHSSAACELSVVGEPRELGPESRLALYRTAQEALTNVRRHAAAERVELRLEYAPDGATLVVQDHGPGAPVAVGAGSGGYGLTGMRERAELLGGRLQAAPADDGFRVELWLPA